MKKFTKGMLIAAGIFGAVGIGLTAAGGVMGASMSELTGVKSLKRVLLVADPEKQISGRVARITRAYPCRIFEFTIIIFIPLTAISLSAM